VISVGDADQLDDAAYALDLGPRTDLTEQDVWMAEGSTNGWELDRASVGWSTDPAVVLSDCALRIWCTSSKLWQGTGVTGIRTRDMT
jgi:hypothetical protein